MNNINRTALFVLSFSFLAISAHAAESVKNPGDYVLLRVADANSLDPALDGDEVSQEVILNLYDTLFTFDGSSTEKLLPLIAETVPSRENGLISADGLTYVIPIRRGIKFHDGSPLTAEDVRYSMMRFMIMDAGPAMMLLDPLAGYHETHDASGKLRPTVFIDADKAVRIEEGKIVLHLPRPFPPLLPILARWCPIVSKSWAVAHGDWDGAQASWTKFNSPKKESSPFFVQENGSGPFKLLRWDRQTMQIILARDDAYWRGPAKFKRVIMKAIPEFGTRKLMLQAGDADSIAADRSYLSQLADLPGVDIIDDLPTFLVSPAIEFCFKMELKGNPYVGSGKLDGNGVPPDFFADKDVRKGFAYAFDYDAFIRDVLHGKGARATGFIPKGMIGYSASQAVYAHDPAKAAEHLRKAFGGRLWEKGFRFTLVYNTGSSTRQTVAQILKKGIEDLNPRFRIDVRPIDWPAYLNAGDKNLLPMQSGGRYAPYPDPHALAFQFMESNPTYQCQYKNAESDRLVDAALHELNLEKRLALYRKLLALEYDDVPFLPLADAPAFRVQRHWLKGWIYNPMIPVDGRLYELDKEIRP